MPAPLPADLGRVDPREAWQPWEPDDSDPFGARWAAHLFRRAGFGAGPEETERAVRDGVGPTLDRLLAGEPGRDSRLDAVLDDLGEQFAAAGDVDRLRGWWVYRMLRGGHPLREKLTLFWHNHFATSVHKVKSAALVHRQNQLLRRHALGRFGPLLREVGRDPAMLVWLDSNQNVKGRPNENYAREVMELFSLGVGHYSEKDVQEAARAFTGWHTDDEGTAFAFHADRHDAGAKTVLGQTGNWHGDDVARILLEQPAAARFLVGKLYRELISETEPPRGLLDPLARGFREADYDVGALVRTMLGSRLFFSGHAFLRRVKSPVEFALGAVRAAWPGPASPAVLAGALDRMGQSLFAPPNVKGWPGGRAWLNTSTLLARNNFAEDVVMRGGQPAPPAPPPQPPNGGPAEPAPNFDVLARFGKLDATRPADLADGLLDLFLPGYAPAAARRQVLAFLQEGWPKGPPARRRVREAAHAVLCMAEYQLC